MHRMTDSDQVDARAAASHAKTQRPHEPHRVEFKRFGPGVDADIVHTDRVTIVHWSIAEGTPIPEHSHENEQVVNVLDGELEFCIDGDTQLLTAGTMTIVPSHAVHSGIARTDCKVIDTFCPVQKTFALESD